MRTAFDAFEFVVRGTVAPERDEHSSSFHPFEVRNIHQDIPAKARHLFDNGHYAEAVFSAFKFIDAQIMKRTGLRISGFALMMQVFNEDAPRIAFNDLITVSEKDEQKGFRHLFAGAMSGIRNPRGHEDLDDDPDVCLDYLVFASMLLRKLHSGLDIPTP